MWRYAITRSYSIVLSKTKSWRKKIEEEKYTESIVEISNDRVTFARLFYYTFLFLPPPILKSFCAMSSRLKNGIPVDKKIFSTRYQRRGILDVGWQRSHGALNIFSVCLSRAKISRSSRRDLPQKKKKKKFELSSRLPVPVFSCPILLFFPLPSPFTRRVSLSPRPGEFWRGFLPPSNIRSSYPDISHSGGGLLVTTRET